MAAKKAAKLPGFSKRFEAHFSRLMKLKDFENRVDRKAMRDTHLLQFQSTAAAIYHVPSILQELEEGGKAQAIYDAMRQNAQRVLIDKNPIPPEQKDMEHVEVFYKLDKIPPLKSRTLERMAEELIVHKVGADATEARGAPLSKAELDELKERAKALKEEHKLTLALFLNGDKIPMGPETHRRLHLIDSMLDVRTGRDKRVEKIIDDAENRRVNDGINNPLYSEGLQHFKKLLLPRLRKKIAGLTLREENGKMPRLVFGKSEETAGWVAAGSGRVEFVRDLAESLFGPRKEEDFHLPKLKAPGDEKEAMAMFYVGMAEAALQVALKERGQVYKFTELEGWLHRGRLPEKSLGLTLSMAAPQGKGEKLDPKQIEELKRLLKE